MTDITLEQRARDIVVQSLISHGYERGAAERMVAGGHLAFEGEDVFAMIKAALRLSAGADSARLDALEALVDQQPDKALLLHHGIHIIKDGERRYPGLGLSNTRRTLRQAIDGSCMIEAAAPRREPGEG